ncbi:MAG: hypothetical protein JJU29_19140 [Verrucomicrobia bacterium]|nr:hypothetical protein [Verrucomicrobiota bacterium]MCH8514152.1 hypothetical protein [Kiritimatiellia bacterium]
MKFCILFFLLPGLLSTGMLFGDELPPGTVTLHVSPSGDDSSGDGSPESPFAGLGGALAEANLHLAAGTPVRLLFAPGVYREGGVDWLGNTYGATLRETPLILEGMEMDAVVFSGAISWSGGWTEIEPGHWTRPWPYAWGYGPDPWVDFGYSLPMEMRRREMLVIDGKRILPVFSLANLTENRFYVDEDGGLIHYRGSNPNLREVEVPVEPYLLNMRGKSNLTMRRISVRHYSNFIDQNSAVRLWGIGVDGGPGSENILVEDCRFDDSSAQGLSVGLYDGGAVRRVRLRGNGYLNASLPSNHNLVVEDIETTDANWRGYPHGELSWSAGGMKVTRAHGLTFRRLVAANNLTNGLWFDVFCGANSVEELHAFGQKNYGLYFELSEGPLVLNGGFFGNNDTAMTLAETGHMEVRNVEAVSNRVGVILRENGRGIPLEGLQFTDNAFSSHRQGDLFVSRGNSVSDEDMEVLAPGFTIERNQYAHAYPNPSFRIPGLTSLAGWQSFLQQYPAITGKDLDAVPANLDITGKVNGPLVWEIWEGLPDATLDALRNAPAFQNHEPDHVERRWLTEDVWGREGDYGQRGSALLRTPVSGTYLFRLSADAEAELWLGLDGPDSFLQQVLTVSSPLGHRAEAGPMYSVNLTAGQVVPLQILHAGRGGSAGNGHVSLLWSRPDLAEFRPVSSVHLLQPRIRVAALVGSTVAGDSVPAVLRIHRDRPLPHPLDVAYTLSGAEGAVLGADMPARIPAGEGYVDIPVSVPEGAISGHQTLTLHLLDHDLAKVDPSEGLASVHLLDPDFSHMPLLHEDFNELSPGTAIHAGNTAFTFARVDNGVSLTATVDSGDGFEAGTENVYARFVDNHSGDLLQLVYDHGEGFDEVATLALDLIDYSTTSSGNYFVMRLSTAANPHESHNVTLALRRENGARWMTTTGTQAQQFALPGETPLRVRLVANNSGETLHQYHDGQSLAPGKIDVWVNGELLGDNLNFTVFLGAMGHTRLPFRSLAFQTFGTTVGVDVAVDNVRLYAGAVVEEGVNLFPELNLTQTAPGTLRATWAGYPEAETYTLLFRRAGTSFWTTATTALPGTAWEFSLPGLAPGENYEVMLRVYAGGVLQDELQAVAPLDAESPPFDQEPAYPHRVVIETEHFHAQSDNGSGIDWTPVTSPSGFSGSAAMKGGPNDPDNFLVWNQNVPTTAPVLSYRVNFHQSGVHYVLVRARAPAANRVNADSFHVGINQTLPESGANIDYTAGDNHQPIPNTGWNWAGVRNTAGQARASIHVPETGVHTIHIWPREDGIMVDQLLLTRDVNDLPSDALTQTAGGPVQEGLAAWRQATFGTYLSYGDAADEADPDGDGVSNFLEYAFGSNPLDAASRPRTQARMNESQTHLILDFHRPLTPNGLRYLLQVNEDLRLEWTDHDGDGVGLYVEENEGKENVTVTVPIETGAAFRFYRISVE